MAKVTQKRTRKQIRQSVGTTMSAINQDGGAVEGTPSEKGQNAATIADEALAFGGGSEFRAGWVVGSDSASPPVVEIRRVFSSSPSDRSLTMTVPFSGTPNTSWTYELWSPDTPPTMAHEFINQALAEVTRKQSISITSDSMHMGGGIRRFNLGDSFTGVREVEYRNRFTGEQFLSFDDAPSTLTSNATVSIDSADFREGQGATKITVAAGESSATAFAASTIDSVDLSKYTQVEYWAKSNVTTSSETFRIRLLNGSSVRETLAMPALNPDSWTYVTTPLSSPEVDTDITVVQLSTGSSDGGSATLWWDDLKAVRLNAEHHRKIPRKFWSIDKDARQLVLDDDAHMGYSKLKITGTRKPNLVSSDSDVVEANSEYVINSVVAKMLRSRGDRTQANRDAAFEQADRYEALAQVQRQRGGVLANIRWVSD